MNVLLILLALVGSAFCLYFFSVAWNVNKHVNEKAKRKALKRNAK